MLFKTFLCEEWYKKVDYKFNWHVISLMENILSVKLM